LYPDEKKRQKLGFVSVDDITSICLACMQRSVCPDFHHIMHVNIASNNPGQIAEILPNK
jgi:nucleoside-diphosphate-sugar epimerase